MKVSSAWRLFGEGWGSGGEGELCAPSFSLSQGSEHLAALDAPNPLKRDSHSGAKGSGL